MIEISNLSFRYPHGNKSALQEVSLSLSQGEIGILLGPNGSGKSTLCKAILNLIKPHSGEIKVEGKTKKSLRQKEYAKLIAYVPQQSEFGPLTVFETVLLGRLPYFVSMPKKEDFEKTERVLRDFGLAELKNCNVLELSGGQKQKVAIARAVNQEAKYLLFDEPTSNLDIGNEMAIVEEAKHLANERGVGILMAIHDINLAYETGDKFFFLKEGKLIKSGGKEIVTSAALEELYGVCVSKIVTQEGSYFRFFYKN